eukprot:4187601-Amphidinium_carterae.1
MCREGKPEWNSMTRLSFRNIANHLTVIGQCRDSRNPSHMSVTQKGKNCSNNQRTSWVSLLSCRAALTIPINTPTGMAVCCFCECAAGNLAQDCSS